MGREGLKAPLRTAVISMKFLLSSYKFEKEEGGEGLEEEEGEAAPPTVITGSATDRMAPPLIVPTAGGTRSWRALGQAEAEHEDRQPAADCIREWRAGRRHQR